ncbi:MAG: DUF5059 domain-containing protein, partial [Halobacteria archaeon]|nr:DUF5059 domain-containing protein [Halobacteria archaeon]
METASKHQANAQRKLTNDETANALELQLLGEVAGNARYLAVIGEFDAAKKIAREAMSSFEESSAHAAVEQADKQSYDAFESGISNITTATDKKDAKSVKQATAKVMDASINGSYALVAEKTAGAGHIAQIQARGYDAKTLASLGGPSTDFAHAAALNIYRARAYDAAWLAERGETETAKKMAQSIFAHFEGARAHEALEEASKEAYHGFEEEGLNKLITAIQNNDTGKIDGAVETVDENVVKGIEALATSRETAVLEAGFFRSRLGDAIELYELGKNEEAAIVVQELFQTFEANEAGLHEAFEGYDKETYENFEKALGNLKKAFENSSDSSVDKQSATVLEELLKFETGVGSTAHVSGAESGYMAARTFDSAALDSLGKSERAATVVQNAFGHFESGAGGFHEALEEADHELYESFESALSAVQKAAT